MFKSKYRICEAFDIPVYIDFSFAILLFLFVMNSGSFSFGLAASLVLGISVTIHELGHALTARVFGYKTRDITLSLLGGCASLIALPRKPWQEFLTAAAGPAVSFLSSAAGYCMLVFLDIENHFLASVIYYWMYMNLMLGIFNLLPGFPLDGGRIFRSVMQVFLSQAKATYLAMAVGRVVAVLLALRGLFSIFSGGNWGLISLFIAWMIWKEGYREYQMVLAEERWRSWSQDDFRARVSPPPYDR